MSTGAVGPCDAWPRPSLYAGLVLQFVPPAKFSRVDPTAIRRPIFVRMSSLTDLGYMHTCRGISQQQLATLDLVNLLRTRNAIKNRMCRRLLSPARSKPVDHSPDLVLHFEF